MGGGLDTGGENSCEFLGHHLIPTTDTHHSLMSSGPAVGKGAVTAKWGNMEVSDGI